jgi:hypothetical protein
VATVKLTAIMGKWWLVDLQAPLFAHDRYCSIVDRDNASSLAATNRPTTDHSHQDLGR